MRLNLPPSRDRERGPLAPFSRLVFFLERAITSSAEIIVFLSMVVLFATLFLNVILRYAFGDGIPGAGDVPRLVFPWLAMGGAVLAAAQSKNIAVDLVYRMLPESGRRVLALSINIVVFALAGAVIYGGFVMAGTATRALPVLQIPIAYGYASLIYGYGCIAVLCVTNTYRVFTRGSQGYQSLA